jgi:hypothetical protein
MTPERGCSSFSLSTSLLSSRVNDGGEINSLVEGFVPPAQEIRSCTFLPSVIQSGIFSRVESHRRIIEWKKGMMNAFYY